MCYITIYRQFKQGNQDDPFIKKILEKRKKKEQEEKEGKEEKWERQD